MLESPSTRRAEQRWVLVGVGLVASLLCAQVVVGFVRADEPSFLEKVETCLTERATPFEEVSGDPIALSAKRGALRTTVDGNSVTVSLGGSEKDAERLYEAYTAVASDEVVATPPRSASQGRLSLEQRADDRAARVHVSLHVGRAGVVASAVRCRVSAGASVRPWATSRRGRSSVRGCRRTSGSSPARLPPTRRGAASRSAP